MNNADKPAHPIYHETNDGYAFITENGLTKREYFAGLAMQGILSNTRIKDEINCGKIAIDSINASDALLKELDQ